MTGNFAAGSVLSELSQAEVMATEALMCTMKLGCKKKIEGELLVIWKTYIYDWENGGTEQVSIHPRVERFGRACRVALPSGFT